MARSPFGVTEFMISPVTASYRDPLSGNERDVFLRIAMSPGTTTTQVAEQANIATEMVSRITKKLIGLGWVIERVDTQDRRIKRLGMTQAGYESLRDHFAHETGKNRESIRVTGVHVWNPDQP